MNFSDRKHPEAALVSRMKKMKTVFLPEMPKWKEDSMQGSKMIQVTTLCSDWSYGIGSDGLCLLNDLTRQLDEGRRQGDQVEVAWL